MRITITLLSYDHGILRQVLDVIAEMGKKETTAKHADLLPSIISFLNEFMDQYHHGKEERFIFPYALHESKDWEQEINKLIADHREAKRMTDEMARALEMRSVEGFAQTGLKLARHMQAHIAEEEDKVFPKLEEGMDPEEDMQLFEQMKDFYEKKYGADFLKKYENYANSLQDKALGPGYFTGVA